MIIEKIIKINGSSWAFWKALSSPLFYAERGGHYECDWKTNSPIVWVDHLGRRFHGKLLQFKGRKYLSFLRYEDHKQTAVRSIISYQTLLLGGNLVIKLSINLIRDCERNELEQYSKWADQHLFNLNQLTQSINSGFEDAKYLAS